MTQPYELTLSGGQSISSANPIPTGDSAVLAQLALVLSKLGAVTLDAATLAALEQITVTVSNLPATQPVSGALSVSNFPATQPVSGPLTDAQLRAGAVPVSTGLTQTTPLTDTQLRAIAVPVSTGLTQTAPLTDTQLRTTPVPVSGTVTMANPTAQGLTDGQLRAVPVPVSGSVTVANLPSTQPVSATSLPLPAGAATDATLTSGAQRIGGTVATTGAFFPAVQPVSQPNSMAVGTLTNLNDVVTLNAQGMNGYSAVVTGTWSGVISLEASVDGVTWNPINGALQGVGTFSTTLTANTQIRGTLGGLSQFRMRLSTVGGGTANVAINAGSGTAGVFMTAPIPLASPTRAQTARIAVGTTAVQLDISPLTKRRAIEVRYNSNGVTPSSFIYVGFNGAVTAATGRELSAGESMHLDLSEVTQMWVIASAAAQPVQFTELGE